MRQGDFMWMTSASTAIYAVKQHPLISRGTMMVVTHTSINRPESPEEEALCKEAMEGCPVEAIGDDSE